MFVCSYDFMSLAFMYVVNFSYNKNDIHKNEAQETIRTNEYPQKYCGVSVHLDAKVDLLFH